MDSGTRQANVNTYTFSHARIHSGTVASPKARAHNQQTFSLNSMPVHRRTIVVCYTVRWPLMSVCKCMPSGFHILPYYSSHSRNYVSGAKAKKRVNSYEKRTTGPSMTYDERSTAICSQFDEIFLDK